MITDRFCGPDLRRTIRAGRLLLVALLAVLVLPLFAQETSEAALTTESIEARIAALEASSGQSGSDTALADYQQALADLEARGRFLDEARGLEAAGIQAPRRQAELREALTAARAQPPEPVLEGSESVEEVERSLSLARAELLAVDQQFQRLRDQAGALRARPEQIQGRLSDAREEAERVQDVLDAAVLTGDEARAEAALTAARARRAALAAEIEFLEQDLLTQPARLGLLDARRDEAALSLERARSRVDELQQALADLRGIEAARTLADSGAFELGAMTDSERIDETLQRNAALATELATLSESISLAAAENRSTQEQLDGLRRRFESAREKIDIVGLSPALGRFLQAEQRDLPEAREFLQSSRGREDRIAEAGLRGLQLEEALDAWRPADERIEELLASVRPERVDAVRADVEGVVQARSELLRQLIAANNDYLRTLSELEISDRQALQVVEDYRDFLSRNLLWLRNESPLSPAKLIAMPQELASVLKSPEWMDGLRVLVLHLFVSPLQIAAVVLLLFTAWKRSAVLEQLRATARSVGKPSADTMGSTLKALLYTIILTVPWPLLTLITGLQMIDGPASNLSSVAFGDALLRMAPILFFLLLLRNLCLPCGVAEVHFQWLPDAVVELRRELFLLGLTLLVPGVFLIIAHAFAPPDQTFGFGQLIYLIPVFGLARFLYRLFYPGKSIVERLKRRPTMTYSPGLGWAWLIGTIAIPVLMGVVAVAGFMYSASILLDRTVQTLLFALALALLSELAARWLLIARRRARLQELLARRAAAREQDGGEATSSAVEGTAMLDAGEDLASLDSDSRKLINVSLSIVALLGVVAIWSPVFPALVNLSGITLWDYAQQVAGEQVIERVSLADLLLALLLAALTYAAARSLPALVEIVLRQRGSVPSGSRLAFATLARYSIVLIGLGLVLSIIGINWSKLQWLVAALGVGIGFGLQEIVANFISGLIILIERPVRVGDVVTVGEDTGRVVRIQIRATTIRKWDQQELIVPNKEFITSRVVNWSLSDETTRIFFMVGVAYGSDVEKALKLIEEAALENPVVLEDPTPLVTFESFGDNSLNLGLRCYVPSVNERLETTTALHIAINRKFAEAGIVIAFPQRDVHLDTSSPLEVRLFGGKDGIEPSN
jgi:potassium efflux system protein